MVNIRKLYRKKSRGVTPVIATVLLIALVVVAGIAIAVVMFGTINTPEPIDIDILSISGFESTDDNIYVDQFTVSLHNTQRTQVRIREIDGFVLEFINGTTILGWSMNLNQDEINLPGNTILDIPLVCDQIDGMELIPENDTIFLEVKVFPEGRSSERSARKFKSDILVIEDTYGPTIFDTQDSYNSLPSTGLDVGFDVTNNGSTDLELLLDFSTDSDEDIYFQINNLNKTTHQFTSVKYSTHNFPGVTFTILPDQAIVSESYLVFVVLYDNINFKPLSMVILSLTYTG